MTDTPLLDELKRCAQEAATQRALTEVFSERTRQDARWGQQDHADGTGRPTDQAWADVMREQCDTEHRAGRGTWRTILAEEFWEAMAESDAAALRKELVQVAAVAVAWVEAIDRRTDAA